MKSLFSSKYVVFAIVALFAGCLMNSVAAQTGKPELAGYWQGSITREDKKWHVNLEFFMENGGLKALADFPDVGGFGREFSVQFNSPQFRLERPQPNGAPLVFSGEIKAGAMFGSWKGLGIETNFTLRKIKKPAANWCEEEITFKNGDISLAGSLILPTSGKRFPLIIFTHGGGAETRAVYLEQAVMFAEKGVAALIYDKRGTGKSSGDWKTAGLTDLTNDALAGLGILKLRPDIDPGQIGIFGHSQGGWIAPLAATRSSDVAFIIVSAASAINAAEQSIYHRANVIRAAGFPESAAVKASELRRRLYETARTKESREELKTDVAKVQREPWFPLSELPHPVPVDEKIPAGVMEMLFMEPLPIWEKVKIPVLAVWGDKDFVVPVERGKQLIAQALQKNGNRDYTIEVFPNVNHSILVERGPADGWDFPRRAPNYFEKMVEWTLKRVKVKG